MDILKIKMPSSIEIEGIFFEIETNFRAWLKFDRLIKDENTQYKDLDYLYINKKPKDNKKAFEALLEFFNPPQELPRNVGGGNGERALDYYYDSDLIYAAFIQCYNIDLLATDKNGHGIKMHWHKFLALINGLTNTRLNEVMGYRGYKPNDKTKYEDIQRRLYNAWRLPTVETKKAREAREAFNSLFEKN